MLQVLEELARRFKTSEHFHRDFRSQATKLGTRTFIPFEQCIYISIYSSTCDVPLGVGNSSVVPDAAISASETHVNYSPAGARLGSLAGWYTNDKPRSRDWVQVDLGQKKHVTKVATQVYVLVFCGIIAVPGDQCSWFLRVILSPTNVCPHKLLTI